MWTCSNKESKGNHPAHGSETTIKPILLKDKFGIPLKMARFESLSKPLFYMSSIPTLRRTELVRQDIRESIALSKLSKCTEMILNYVRGINISMTIYPKLHVLIKRNML
jgi:hypothetical protein